MTVRVVEARYWIIALDTGWRIKISRACLSDMLVVV
jgi:hypothetical protein